MGKLSGAVFGVLTGTVVGLLLAAFWVPVRVLADGSIRWTWLWEALRGRCAFEFAEPAKLLPGTFREDAGGIVSDVLLYWPALAGQLSAVLVVGTALALWFEQRAQTAAT